MKAILLLLVVAMLYWIFFGRRTKDASSPPPRESGQQQRIVSCSYCHLHVPESEAIRVAGRNYCCDEHRRLDES
jgi:hypothetical protein